ncbi:MAG: anthranilate phosphoribosyltransferase [Candidatus Pelagibacter sp.]|nr:anthranilate phosphoribosyltransferase [Candidatus Pelagibacter sp.]|tara:strand:+ start:9442 stop:10434 length:993 start_codon:yes stop_codon:yes gene_type:complete
MDEIIKRLKNKQNLSFEESKSVFESIMSGKVKEEQIHDFLTSSSAKGEASDEIAGGVYVLRNKATQVNVPDNTVDTCGTGGDGKNTLNISTGAALLLSSFGTKVAKHGNKSVSSKCGSADVLEKLNININLGAKEVETSINKNNFGFMFAPEYHSTMKYVGPIRKRIGKRTIFNLIGPLSSPAKVKRQVVGVFDKKLLKIFAEALKNLNLKKALIVNSQDGLDEISPYANTDIAMLSGGKIKESVFCPKDLDIEAVGFNNIVGKDPEYNAKKMIEIFKGKDNDFSIAVCLNAAAGLLVDEKPISFKEGYDELRKHILSGKVINHITRLTK